MNPSIAKKFVILLFLALSACQSIAAEPTTETPVGDKPVTPSAAIPATTAGAEQSAAKNASPKTDAYVLQPGDILQIDVWKEKDLMRQVKIRPDGGINFPLAGDVAAAGRTVEQLRNDLKEKLAKYVPDPVVTVAVMEGVGNKIYIIGKVNKPGEYVASRNMDVMQALTMAGGLSPYASENNIKILRRVNGEQKTFRFKYSRVEKGEDLEQNIILQGGDTIVVP